MKRKLVAVMSIFVTASMLLSSYGVKKAAGETVKAEKKANEVIEAEHPEIIPAAARHRKDTVIIGTEYFQGKFNPIHSITDNDVYVTSMVFDGLVTNGKEGNAVPNAAEKWEISKDNKTYTFHLKKGIKFSNGDELTAKDVAFTYTAIADPNYDGMRTDAVEKLVGYNDYKKGNAASVSGIKVIDNYTISFTETEIKAPVLLSDFSYGIMSKKYYGFKKGGAAQLKKLFSKPMGSGCYILKNYKAGEEVDFEANPNYFKGAPKIKNVVMKVINPDTVVQELISGGIDMDMVAAKPENVNMLKEAGFLNLELYPANQYGYIGLNLRREMFKDKNVRKALMYGLNRKGFVDSYYKGYADVCNAPMSSASWAYTEDIEKYYYNPEKANKLLDEAGWKKRSDGWRYKDGKKFEIHWLTYTGSKYVDNLIPIVKENYKALGIDVIPELMEFVTLVSKTQDKRDFDMFNMAWSLSIDPDQSGIFSIEQDVPGGSNCGGWRNEESEKLLKEGLSTTDENKRKEIYQKWVKVANDDLPYLYLNQGKDMWAVSSRIKGMEVSPYMDWTHFIAKAEIVDSTSK